MAAYYRAGQALGLFSANANPSSAGSFSLSAAANWAAYAFVPDEARTLSAVRVFASSVTGTLGASDVTCDLYDSTGASGNPGGTLETGKLPSATLTASGWYDFTGFTTAVSAGQQYWAVFKNANATPASNFPALQGVNSFLPAWLAGSSFNRESWGRATSTNSGTSWSQVTEFAGHRIAYADGSYDGAPVSATASSADLVYSARESGVKFTTPANGALKVSGLAVAIAIKTGTPTGSPRLGLWTGSTPSNLAYTASLNAPSNTQWIYGHFASTQTVQPGTVCRVTLGETAQSDTSSNAYKLQEVTWDTDANSLALTPFGGTLVKTYFDGTTWTDTAGKVFYFALLLDTGGEFGASGGGTGGVMGSRIFTGF